jgi:hypothetical protein
MQLQLQLQRFPLLPPPKKNVAVSSNWTSVALWYDITSWQVSQWKTESRQINKKLLLKRNSSHVKILKKNSDGKLSYTVSQKDKQLLNRGREVRRHCSAAQTLSFIIHQLLPYEQQKDTVSSLTPHAVKIRKHEAIILYYNLINFSSKTIIVQILRICICTWLVPYPMVSTSNWIYGT